MDWFKAFLGFSANFLLMTQVSLKSSLLQKGSKGKVKIPDTN